MARPHFDGMKPAAEAAPTPTNHEVLPMAEITASLVKELRERTGAGMMECKEALTETGGDVDAAAELLRKSGLAKADKTAGRGAAEGPIAMARATGKAVPGETHPETALTHQAPHH